MMVCVVGHFSRPFHFALGHVYDMTCYVIGIVQIGCNTTLYVTLEPTAMTSTAWMETEG